MVAESKFYEKKQSKGFKRVIEERGRSVLFYLGQRRKSSLISYLCRNLKKVKEGAMRLI